MARKRRNYVRDSRGRFASTPGTRRGRALAGVRRAGLRRGYSGGVEYGSDGPRATLRKDVFRSDRVTAGGSLSVGRDRRRRIVLGGGIHASVAL